MAQYRLSAQIIGRKTGRSAVACAAYRSGEVIAETRTGQMHDYTRKQGITHTEIMAPQNAPAWMHDRAMLWNAVEAAERRKDAQLCREVQLSLPHELTADERRELVRGFVQKSFVDKGMIADLAIHQPGPREDHRNHHAHVMLTMRELTGGGFGKKSREWNDRDRLAEWRKEWEQHLNAALFRAGRAERVDSRSYKDRGIDREPTQHLGPAAHQMEKRGAASRIGDENRAANENNRQRANRHGLLAQLQLQLDGLDDRFERQRAAQVHAVENAHQWTRSDLKSRHTSEQARERDRIEKVYGEPMRTLAAERQALESRMEATGWRSLVRRVTGQTVRDADRLDRLKLNQASIAERIRQGWDALNARQADQLKALEKAHEKRKADIAAETERQKKAERDALMRRRLVAAQSYQKNQAERFRKKAAQGAKVREAAARSDEIAAKAIAAAKTPEQAPRAPYQPSEKDLARFSQEAHQVKGPSLEQAKLPPYPAVWGRRGSDGAGGGKPAPAETPRRREHDAPAPMPDVKAAHEQADPIRAIKQPNFTAQAQAPANDSPAPIADATAAHERANPPHSREANFSTQGGNLSQSEKDAKTRREADWGGEGKATAAWDWFEKQRAATAEPGAEREKKQERGLSLGLKFSGGGGE
ncbi:MobQ family relaxase [Jiella marina]|uniref:MobQ family relaxase n=1 Tax=Jiella sp. LLJ827 TaxID=2917712 RepID=UPI002100A621|nr:MobA/MobL family protein [Jiella sp. LLJ827]